MAVVAPSDVTKYASCILASLQKIIKDFNFEIILKELTYIDPRIPLLDLLLFVGVVVPSL